MELSISLGYLQGSRTTKGKVRSLEAAARICREAGFRYVNHCSNLLDPDWERRAHEDKEILDREGIIVEQTHAPYNRYSRFTLEEFPEIFHRAFVVASILGAENVVVR